MQIHAIRTGTLTGNRTFMRGTGWASVLRRREDVEFPAQFFVIETREGLVAVDSGLSSDLRVPLAQRRFVPTPVITPDEEAGPRLRAAGLDPREIRTVVLTHLDWDHAGGLRHFPNAEILIHGPELEYARRLPGRLRYQPSRWPRDFEPTVYELDQEELGPFPRSRRLDRDGELTLVPLPGHSIGQVGVLIRRDGGEVLLCADHCLRADWFEEDVAAGRELSLGIFFRDQAVETTRRIVRLMRERSVALVPSHDAEAAARIAGAGANQAAVA